MCSGKAREIGGLWSRGWQVCVVVPVKSPADVFMHFLAEQKIYALREGGERSLNMCSDNAGMI